MNKLGRLRISAAVGYLAPARIRPNLTVRPDTSVRRLLFKGARCTGAEIQPSAAADGEGVSIIGARLVILSAGALMSPTLLLRSGIGPQDQLQHQG